MPAETEYQIWRQLRGAFKIKKMVFVPVIESMKNYAIDQYATMEEALEATKDAGERAFLEPSGYKGMYDLPQGDIVLILGDSGNDNMQHAQVNETYMIKAPSVRTHLYGVDAAAIALAYRYGQ